MSKSKLPQIAIVYNTVYRVIETRYEKKVMYKVGSVRDKIYDQSQLILIRLTSTGIDGRLINDRAVFLWL